MVYRGASIKVTGLLTHHTYFDYDPLNRLKQPRLPASAKYEIILSYVRFLGSRSYDVRDCLISLTRVAVEFGDGENEEISFKEMPWQRGSAQWKRRNKKCPGFPGHFRTALLTICDG